MDIDKLQDMADSVATREQLVRFLDVLGKSISSGDVPNLKSYEVLDGCENFAADLDGWCMHQKIPFDEQPTWSLVAWIILAGALND